MPDVTDPFIVYTVYGVDSHHVNSLSIILQGVTPYLNLSTLNSLYKANTSFSLNKRYIPKFDVVKKRYIQLIEMIKYDEMMLIHYKFATPKH